MKKKVFRAKYANKEIEVVELKEKPKTEKKVKKNDTNTNSKWA